MNARVGSSAVVTGTAQNIGNGQPLWLAVYDYTATRYYPHEETLTVSSTGQWKTTAHFGSDGTYDIVVFAANDNANSQLQQYLRTGQNAGLTNLPAGSVELARVTVYKT